MCATSSMVTDSRKAAPPASAAMSANSSTAAIENSESRVLLIELWP